MSPQSVKDLRAANPLVDPSDDVTENSLRVVVELSLFLLGCPAHRFGHWHPQNIVERAAVS